MPGGSPHSDEAGSTGHADVPKAAPATDAASSDDLIGVAQPDIQHQQETWVKYTTLQEGMVLTHSAVLQSSSLLQLVLFPLLAQLHIRQRLPCYLTLLSLS